MEFAQQIEENLAERPLCAYDVMDYILKSNSNYNNNMKSLQNAQAEIMCSSLNSCTALEDTTPDSGVQTLDSESSELMVESISSQNGIEFDDILKPVAVAVSVVGAAPVVASQIQIAAEEHVVDSNSNVAPKATVPETDFDMTASACSPENIVYRRKARKATSTPKAPKKRVSFHEDILKNTRTDNIHIEHGFVTYKNGRKLTQHIGVGVGGVASAAGRYSWCSERETSLQHTTTELCAVENIDRASVISANTISNNRRLVYRNACSDVLDYGNVDIYDTNEPCGLQYYNSGVFEYSPQKQCSTRNITTTAGQDDKQLLYRCACSSSNSSLDSDEQDKNSNCKEYKQAKSSSCDCIGMNQANNNLINDNCYYSEPSIGNLNDGSPKHKSVWNKEKKPKTSCLKKTKRHTHIIQEHDLNTKVKKFNVHDIKNQLLDNSSKMIFGSLKSIFTMPLPERGVPEGSEDITTVVECLSELESTPDHKIFKEMPSQFEPESPPLKAKPYLSKSLDGSKQPAVVKKFVHNVDEQLRRKNDEETVYTATCNDGDNVKQCNKIPLQRQSEFESDKTSYQAAFSVKSEFRNKFIINCESTVFEHTGISYETNKFSVAALEQQKQQQQCGSVASLLEKDTPVAQPAATQLRNTFISTPIAKTFTNFFRSFKETPTAANTKISSSPHTNEQNSNNQSPVDTVFPLLNHLTTAHSSSTIFEICSPLNGDSIAQQQVNNSKSINNNITLAIGQNLHNNVEKQTRHLQSPLKKSGSGGNLLQPQRYGNHNSSNNDTTYSSDLFNNVPTTNSCYLAAHSGSGCGSKSTLLSEEFDDILTITTTTDVTETGADKQNVTENSDIVIVDYPADMCDSRHSLYSSSTLTSGVDYAQLLKPAQPPAAKTSLINRFLRNVTQKKILESSIRQNNFFANKLRSEQKLLAQHLYLPGARPKNYELIDDLNAEIAMEIEMSGVNSPRRELAVGVESDLPGDMARFDLGIGEVSIDIFNSKSLPILRETHEQLMKVFKLYTGYSREGFMTPVLVFLTDKTLYVTDLVRNCLCAKFVLVYADLDVILIGPFSNTVLLSNSARDKQQVLLAGGPYPADALVANLELCARRNGSVLPAVGQLTLEHFAPLQAFVRSNACVGKDDNWLFYAVVNVPTSALGMDEQEPLGPHVKGFLMHRRIKDHASAAAVAKIGWNPGYFLLKAGVLYIFTDSSQKIPSWAMALAECQGARRAVKSARPHCFEIILKGELLQMAAPDEYVASDWLQALLQSANGLFELQEKHKTLGCTLIVTQNHLITLREDFTTPLRQVNKQPMSLLTETKHTQSAVDDMLNELEPTGSLLSSAMSTPTRGTQRFCSSLNSTPTKLSQVSRSTNYTNTAIISTSTTTYTKQQLQQQQQQQANKHAQITKEIKTNMSSVYGKDSGLEILTCADIKEMTGIKISAHNESWWCVLEFSCQEAPLECYDDLIIFFASNSEMQRFLHLVEQLWQQKNNDLFPITILDEDEPIAEQCTLLYMDINRSWEPLLSAALGYPL